MPPPPIQTDVQDAGGARVQVVREVRREESRWGGRWRPIVFGGVMGGLFTLVSAILARVVPMNHGRAAVDHLNYHEPTIRVFAERWPDLDLVNYWSATSPLYHIVVGGLTRGLDLSRYGMMVWASGFTALLIALIAGGTAARAGLRRGFVLTLPLAASLYVWQSGVYLLPDNAGWAGVVAILLLALRPRFDATTLIAGSVILALLVSIRQIHLWSAGVLWAAAWLGTTARPPAEAYRGPSLFNETRALVFGDQPAKLGRLALALIATVPAAGLVVALASMWGGLVPPLFQNMYHGWNPATPVFFLTIVGMYAPFYAGWIVPALVSLWRQNPGLLIAAGAAAVALAFVPETTYDWDAGRKSGVWNLVRIATPELIVFGRTSLVMVVPTVVGAVSLIAVLSMCRRRNAWIYSGAIVAFVAAQTASPELWQRYHEPFILIVLALVCSKTESHPMMARTGPGRWLVQLKFAGPVALSVAFVGLGLFASSKGRPVHTANTGALLIALDAEPVEGLPVEYHPIDKPKAGLGQGKQGEPSASEGRSQRGDERRGEGGGEQP